MATPISTDPTVFFVNFATGNDFTAPTYFTYAIDLDSDLIQIRTTVNQLVNEVNAVNGPASLIAQDLIFVNDSDGPIGIESSGVVGEHSYRVSIGGDTTTVDVQAGQALAVNTRVSRTFDTNLSGVGLGGSPVTGIISIDVNGVPSVAVGTGLGILDIASVAWDGSDFTGAVTQLAEILFDGDDYRRQRIRPVTGNWITTTYRTVAERIETLERAITGIDTDPSGAAISPLGIAGSASLPGAVVSDGVTPDTNSGLFRQAADALGFTATGTERLRWGTFGERFAQDGSAGTPVLSRTSATNRGIYFTAGGVAISVNGAQQIEVLEDQVRGPVGSASLPGLSFIGDQDTGVSAATANTLELSTAGAVAGRFDPQGNLDLPLNGSVILRRTTDQTIPDVTQTAISWDTEDRDRGGWISVTSTNLVCPTGYDGDYIITVSCEWEEAGAGANSGQRLLGISVNGTLFGIDQTEAVSALRTLQSTFAFIPLVATDVIQGVLFHNSGSNEDIDVARLTLHKVG